MCFFGLVKILKTIICVLCKSLETRRGGKINTLKKEKSASSWLKIHNCLRMHGQQNIPWLTLLPRLPKLYGTVISNVSIQFLVTKVANVLMVTVSQYTALAGHTPQYHSESWTLKEQNKSGN
jgi:hypothetical protein